MLSSSRITSRKQFFFPNLNNPLSNPYRRPVDGNSWWQLTSSYRTNGPYCGDGEDPFENTTPQQLGVIEEYLEKTIYDAFGKFERLNGNEYFKSVRDFIIEEQAKQTPREDLMLYKSNNQYPDESCALYRSMMAIVWNFGRTVMDEYLSHPLDDRNWNTVSSKLSNNVDEINHLKWIISDYLQVDRICDITSLSEKIEDILQSNSEGAKSYRIGLWSSWIARDFAFSVLFACKVCSIDTVEHELSKDPKDTSIRYGTNCIGELVYESIQQSGFRSVTLSGVSQEDYLNNLMDVSNLLFGEKVTFNTLREFVLQTKDVGNCRNLLEAFASNILLRENLSINDKNIDFSTLLGSRGKDRSSFIDEEDGDDESRRNLISPKIFKPFSNKVDSKQHISFTTSEQDFRNVSIRGINYHRKVSIITNNSSLPKSREFFAYYLSSILNTDRENILEELYHNEAVNSLVLSPDTPKPLDYVEPFVSSIGQIIENPDDCENNVFVNRADTHIDWELGPLECLLFYGKENQSPYFSVAEISDLLISYATIQFMKGLVNNTLSKMKVNIDVETQKRYESIDVFIDTLEMVDSLVRGAFHRDNVNKQYIVDIWKNVIVLAYNKFYKVSPSLRQWKKLESPNHIIHTVLYGFTPETRVSIELDWSSTGGIQGIESMKKTYYQGENNRLGIFVGSCLLEYFNIKQ